MSDSLRCWNCGTTDSACSKRYTESDEYCCEACEDAFAGWDGTPHVTKKHKCQCRDCGRRWRDD